MVLLERDRQLSQLEDALAATADGGSVVLVSGEAGIGKTSLVRHFAEAHARGAHVLWGTCDDLSTPLPLCPVHDIASEHPDLRVALDEDDRPRLFRQMIELLNRVPRPTILVIEDAHWADEATLDLIVHVGRRIEATRGVLVVSSRDVALTLGGPLDRVVGELPVQSLVNVQLEPLSRGAIEMLARGSERSVDEVVELTRGNPLLVDELLASDDASVSGSLRALARRRLSVLSSTARELLALMAVVPGEVEMWLVEATTDVDPDVLEEAETNGLIELGPNSARFRHELVRRAVAESLPSVRRQQLHARVLASLIERKADPSRIVHHARAAGDLDAIVRFAPVAARRAAAVNSHREAVEHYRLLDGRIDRLPEDARAEALLGWARAELTVGDAPAGVVRASEAVDVLRPHGDDEAVVSALLHLSQAQWFAAQPASAIRSVDEAISVLSEHPPDGRLARALSERGALAAAADDTENGLALACRAIELAEAADDRGALAHGLATKGRVIAHLHYPQGTDLLVESRSIADRHHYGYHSLRATIIHAEIALLHRDLPIAERLITEGLDLALDRQRDSFELDFRALRAQQLLMMGRFDEARTELGYELRTSRSSKPGEHPWLTGRLKAVTGGADAHDDLTRARTVARATNELVHRARVAAATLELAWTHRSTTDIVDEAAGLLEAATRVGHRWLTGELAYWLWKHDRISSAPTPSADPYRLQIGGQWEAAAVEWHRLGLPYERALALAEGDTDARLTAIGLLDELGAVPMATRLRQDVREATGIRVRRPRTGPSSRRGGLSPRQFEVLTLLADELTNAEIAQRLYISVRTAEHHVAAVMTCLGATTRSEAVDLAIERGVLDGSS